MTFIRSLTLLPWIVFTFTSVTFADGFEVGFFTLEHDEKSNVLEIVHRLYQSDVELALSEIEERSVTLEQSPESEALIRSYFRERFTLTSAEGSAIPLGWQGIELTAGTLFVHQEATPPPGFTTLMIRNGLLIDTHENQINMMHATVWEQFFRRDFMDGGVVQRLKRSE